jgi:hypothetical protein
MPKPITRAEIEACAASHKIEYAALAAVMYVEAGWRDDGKLHGFWADGRLKNLFEAHYMWRRLVARGIDPKVLNQHDPKLCFSPNDYGQLAQKARVYGTKNWDKLDRIRAFGSEQGKRLHPNDPAAAGKVFESYKQASQESCSWGLPQVMGSHYARLGFPGVYELRNFMEKSEANQLDVMMRFIKTAGLIDELREQDWVGLARGYNGSAAVAKYSGLLRAAYGEFS